MAERKLIPVACTLDSVELRDRAGQWSALLSRHMRSRRETDHGLEVRFAPDASAELAELVAGEQACCAWADWAVCDDGTDVVLTATSADPTGVATLHQFFVT